MAQPGEIEMFADGVLVPGEFDLADGLRVPPPQANCKKTTVASATADHPRVAVFIRIPPLRVEVIEQKLGEKCTREGKKAMAQL
jgi:hypothetical protein